MKIIIIHASRYGSTEIISKWIAERLTYDNHTVDVLPATSQISPEDYDLILFGGGVYTHDLLPEIETFIGKYSSELQKIKSAVFGVAMQTKPVFTGKEITGGILMLDKYAKLLGENCIYLGMLNGEIVFHKMNKKDKSGIDQFYKMIKLPEEEIAKRKSPRTSMNKAEVWEYAEAVMQKMSGAKKHGH